MSCGCLYVVSTPIGNMEDITFRAVRILKEVDLVVAEDTRRTRQLLTALQIRKPVTSYHAYTQSSKEQGLVKLLEAGQSLALVSDAGTPGISDPGSRIIEQAIQAGIEVVPVPGPTAVTTALVVSGLPLHRFIFIGFLNPKSSGRKRQMEALKEGRETMVFYESPHRVEAMLADALEIWGDRRVAVARELTKKFEEVIRGPLSQVLMRMKSRAPRGEYCVMVEGRLLENGKGDAAERA